MYKWNEGAYLWMNFSTVSFSHRRLTICRRTEYCRKDSSTHENTTEAYRTRQQEVPLIPNKTIHCICSLCQRYFISVHMDSVFPHHVLLKAINRKPTCTDDCYDKRCSNGLNRHLRGDWCTGTSSCCADSLWQRDRSGNPPLYSLQGWVGRSILIPSRTFVGLIQHPILLNHLSFYNVAIVLCCPFFLPSDLLMLLLSSRMIFYL